MSAVIARHAPNWAACLLRTSVYAAAAALLTGPVLRHFGDWYIGWPGDPQQFMWYLGWVWHALLTGQNPFYTQLINAPAGQNLMWNTSILAESALFGWLMTWLPGAALYNLLWLINWMVACLLGDALLRHLGVRPWLAAAGGLFLGGMPYFTAQSLYHLHLWATSVPLALALVLLRALRHPPRRPAACGILIGGLAAFQFYTSIEIAATFALTLAIGALFLILTLRSRARQAFRLPFRTVAAALLTAIVLAAPGIWTLLHGSARPQGKLLPSEAYVNDLLNFVLPTPVYALHNAWTTNLSLQYTGNFWENNGYLGISGLLWLVFAAARLWRIAEARAAAYTFAAIAVLSMGPNLHIAGRVTHVPLPWLLLEHVPFIDSALPSRLMLYGDGIAIGLGFRALEEQLRRSSRPAAARALAGATLLCVGAAWWPVTPYLHSPTPAAARALTQPGPVLDAVAGRPTYFLSTDTPDVMQALADGGYRVPMVNPYGYTGNPPPRRTALAQMTSVLNPNVPESDIRAAAARALPILGAERLVYYPVQDGQRLPAAAERALTALLGPPVAEADGVQVWQVPNPLPHP